MSEVRPVDGSLCTTSPAAWPFSLEATSSGDTGSPQRTSTRSTSIPNLSVTSANFSAKMPLLNASTRSPGLSVLTTAASHAPVPEPAHSAMRPSSVPKTRRRFATTSKVTSGSSGPRWSTTARSIARKTLSGTLVGPGICRKCRPDWDFEASLDTHYGAPLRGGDWGLLGDLIDSVAENLDLSQLGDACRWSDVLAQRVVECRDQGCRVLLRVHEVGKQ